MGKPKETIIKRFDGGLANDRRINQSNKYAITKHFDVFSFPHRLVPYYATEADEAKAKLITRFAVSAYDGGFRLYGLGKSVADDTKVAIYRHADGATLGWEIPTDGESTSLFFTDLDGEILFEYKSKLYTMGDNFIMSFEEGTGWTYERDLTAVASVADPVHHQNDDIAYFFHDNKVTKLDDTVFTEDALTLPDNLEIKSACQYGNYLAIGCSTKDSIKPKSTVFLWDRDTSLETLSERIDFGEGVIKKLASLDNKLIAVMDYHLNDIYGVNGGSILIKQASGDKARTINEIKADEIGGGVQCNGVVDGNLLYLPMSVIKDGDKRRGIWAIDSFGNASIDYMEEEVETADSVYNGIFKTGNVWWIAHSDDGSVNRTDLTASPYYSYTSIYESLIFDEKDNSKLKKLIGFTVMHEALGTNTGASLETVVVKYRKDKDLRDDSAWTTLLTSNVADSVYKDAINIGEETLPEYREIQFRLESTGGAVITGFKFSSELLSKELYG